MTRHRTSWDAEDINALADDVDDLQQAPGGGSSPYLVAVTQIDDAQILALAATEIEVIDNVPAGKAVWIESLEIVLDASNGAYVYAGSELDLGFASYWQDFNGVGPLDPTTPTVQAMVARPVASAAPALFYSGLVNSAGIDVSQIDGVSFCIGNISGIEWTGGGSGNTLSVRVVYRLVDTTPFAA